MKNFLRLLDVIDQPADDLRKINALASYLDTSNDNDKLWTIALLTGRRPKRVVTLAQLQELVVESFDIPIWLLNDSKSVVGDMAETIALVVPLEPNRTAQSLTDWMDEITALAALDFTERNARILETWSQLEPTERYIFNKLIIGSFRTTFGDKLIANALSVVTDECASTFALRLAADWNPESTTFEKLFASSDAQNQNSHPTPFNVIKPLECDPKFELDPNDWHAEWKWDGVRAQTILRHEGHYIWSEDGELMTSQFPELARLRDFLPNDTVLDGELVAWGADQTRPFSTLKTRLGRKTVSKKILQDTPVVFIAFDLLELNRGDLRAQPFQDRRSHLESLLNTLPADAPIRLAQNLSFDSWSNLQIARQQARKLGATGLTLKRKSSLYHECQSNGDWLNWELDPLTIIAVMIYAQQGRNRGASSYTEFTFAVWNGTDLIPFTKAMPEFSDAEAKEISTWVQKNTQQRFGPVRQVDPYHVFEIAFDGVHASKRHKSGLTLRNPRVTKWLRGKTVDDINALGDLKGMIVTQN